MFSTMRSAMRPMRFAAVRAAAAPRAPTVCARSISSVTTPLQSGVTYESLNENLKTAQYAVRGAIVLRAMELAKQMAAGEKLPFDRILYCNIGNPQSLEQKPLTFNRQVHALLECPDLMNNESLFPADVVARAKHLLSNIPGGLGAYSESQGVAVVRDSIAKFITERDGYPSNPSNIFVTDGASPAVQMMIRATTRDATDAHMIPIPQYPLYSASIALYGGTAVGYELDESADWGLPVEKLKSELHNARAKGLNVRSVSVINPGNPTGTCLTYDNISEIVEFAAREGLVLMADEVYQTNIWQDARPFVSFKKVACDIGALEGKDMPQLQLASFHSVSKGFLGECGKRGGYVELEGFDQKVKDELYKLVSISLCSNIAGQVMMELMVNPPREGDPSYETYAGERDAILSSLQRRATKLVAALNKLDGVDCLPAQGALYVFPQITLPAAAKQAAEDAGMAPDAFYCLRLLEEQGIVVVPGSGFGQADGTFHFRSTILPPEEQMDSVIERLSTFHNGFMAKYGQ